MDEITDETAINGAGSFHEESHGTETTPVYATYDETTNDSLTTVVIDALATATDCDPLELEPLYTAIDPDALESIFETSVTGQRRTGSLSFPFQEFVVTVTDGSRVAVESR